MPEEIKPADKTPEQIAQERLERYQKDPQSFIECNDLVVAAIKNPKSAIGISVAVGTCKRSELDIAWAEINHIIHKFIMRMEVEADMKRQAAESLIKPAGKHGIMNFARGRN